MNVLLVFMRNCSLVLMLIRVHVVQLIIDHFDTADKSRIQMFKHIDARLSEVLLKHLNTIAYCSFTIRIANICIDALM